MRLLWLERRPIILERNWGRIICSFSVLYKTPHKTYINKRKSGDLRAKVPYMHPSPGLLSKFSGVDMWLLLLDKTETHHIGEDENFAYSKTIANCKYIIIYFPQGFSEIYYNTGWGTFDKLLVVQFTINEVMSSWQENNSLGYECPLMWMRILDRPLHRVLRPPYFTNSVWLL